LRPDRFLTRHEQGPVNHIEGGPFGIVRFIAR
jgi:hypothetical protein